MRVHGRAGQIPAPDRADGRIPQGSRNRLDPIIATIPRFAFSTSSRTTGAICAAVSGAARFIRSRAGWEPTSSPLGTRPTISANRSCATLSSRAASAPCLRSHGRSQKDFRLIRPLVFVTEDLTARLAESLGAPVIPCGCSLRAGKVRRSLRGLLGDLEKEHPRLKESLLSAMANIETDRLLDLRYLPSDGPVETPAATNPLAILSGD